MAHIRNMDERYILFADDRWFHFTFLENIKVYWSKLSDQKPLIFYTLRLVLVYQIGKNTV